jgi:hypothetical protein
MIDWILNSRQGTDSLRIASIAALPRENGRDAVPPEALNRRQDILRSTALPVAAPPG